MPIPSRLVQQDRGEEPQGGDDRHHEVGILGEAWTGLREDLGGEQPHDQAEQHQDTPVDPQAHAPERSE
jgi:hypothetical protein